MSSEIVNTLKAFSDETRLRIIHLIDQCGPDLCVCDMVAVLKLPQSTISRQLMRLRHVGLVTDSRDGMWINYSMQQGTNPIRSALLSAMQECWLHDPVFAADRALFDELHAKNEIVRCKRVEKLRQQNLEMP